MGVGKQSSFPGMSASVLTCAHLSSTQLLHPCRAPGVGLSQVVSEGMKKRVIQMGRPGPSPGAQCVLYIELSRDAHCVHLNKEAWLLHSDEQECSIFSYCQTKETGGRVRKAP